MKTLKDRLEDVKVFLDTDESSAVLCASIALNTYQDYAISLEEPTSLTGFIEWLKAENKRISDERSDGKG